MQYAGRSDRTRDPHIFGIAADTFNSLVEYGRPQSVIISGESGAGKTEATKLVLKVMVFVRAEEGEVTLESVSV